jgi:hypothetical protein
MAADLGSGFRRNDGLAQGCPPWVGSKHTFPPEGHRDGVAGGASVRATVRQMMPARQANASPLRVEEREPSAGEGVPHERLGTNRRLAPAAGSR